jgi:hypothetical protein
MLFPQLVATLAYLLPVAIWVWLRLGREGAEAGDARFAIELSLGVAVDLLSVLVLAHVVQLETATLISRGVWCVVGGVVYARRRRAGRRSPPLDRAALMRLGALALVVLGAVALSVSLSRACGMWDRQQHIPLVTALRGQRLPFFNVYAPAQPLFYHFGGDVQAAMLQSLSGARLHASLALSLLHDVMFALLALNVVCFVRAMGVKRTALAAAVFVAVVMLGPVTILRDDTKRLESGFGLVNLLTLSFRPHVTLSYLLSAGFFQLLFLALTSEAEAARWRARLAELVALTSALVLADEASLGLIGLAMGALWLFAPQVLAPTRRAGMLALGALLAAMVGTTILFGGSLGPNAPHYALTFVAPRAPGYATPAVPLSLPDGRLLLFQDVVPMLGVLASLAVIAARARDRVITGLTIFFATLAVTSLFAITCIDFEGQPSENHRFATAMFALAPLVVALVLERRVRQVGPGAALGGLAALTALASMGLGVASTIEWLGSGVAYRQCVIPTYYGYDIDRFFELDCRVETGATMGETLTATYVDVMGFYLWTGCHPSWAPAPASERHKIKNNGPWYGHPAYDQLNAGTHPGAPIDVACITAPAAGPNVDPACVRAPAVTTCVPRGTHFKSCRLEGPARSKMAAGM